jgi:abnormal spindle-like microcephaly-associated protein
MLISQMLLPFNLQCQYALFQKVIAPSDTSKKRLSNCTTAIQYMKQAQVPLSDSDGVTILAEDIAAGDKELSLSLLWNVFVYMQVKY